MNRCTQLEILQERVLTTAQTLSNFKVIGQRLRSFFRKWTKVQQIDFVERGKNRSS